MNSSQILIYFITESIIRILTVYSVSGLYNNNIILNKKNLLIILFSSVISVINSIYNFTSFKIVITFLILIFLFKIVYKIKFIDAFKGALIFTITSVTVEILLSIIFVSTNKDIINIINNSLLIKPIFSLIEILLTMFILNNKYVISIIKKIDKILSKRKVKVILVFSVLLLGFLLVILTGTLYNIKVVILSIICAVLIIAILILYTNYSYNMDLLLERNKILKESNSAYHLAVEDYKIMKHNLKNELFSLKVCNQNEYKNKIDDLIKKYNKNTEWISTINEIPEGLQGLIFLKQKEASKFKVKMYINVKSNIKDVDNDYIDLCNSISILLDNATEATKNTKSKLIVVNIDDTKNNIYFNIKNTFNNKIDINKIGQKNYSTKDLKSGLGINFIKNLNKNKIKVQFSIIDNIFSVNLCYKKISRN